MPKTINYNKLILLIIIIFLYYKNNICEIIKILKIKKLFNKYNLLFQKNNNIIFFYKIKI